MTTTYGYARVSTNKQSLPRQIQRIRLEAPEAIIFEEKYTGTTQDRPEWKKLLKAVKKGDTIIFDEVSRMSRNAEEGFRQYTELFEKGVELVFLRTPTINTSNYRKALETQIEATGDEVADCIIEALNKVLRILQRKQIESAFQQPQQERDDNSYRTSSGMKAKGATNEYDADGNIVKQGSISKAKTGKNLTTKKSIEAKAIIRKHSKDFGGSLNDADCQKLAQVSRNSFYKYKREIKEGL